MDQMEDLFETSQVEARGRGNPRERGWRTTPTEFLKNLYKKILLIQDIIIRYKI